MADDLRGRAIHAILVPAARTASDDRLATAVLDGLRGRLASDNIPAAASFANALPCDRSGQLLRRMLHEQLRRILSEEAPR